jgi:hypothetical protein
MRLGLVILLMLGSSCFGQQKTTGNKYTTCQLVEKFFVKKNGEQTEISELYLRCSIQDYYIKLCESSVTREDLEPFIDQGISVEMEINEGSWDICKDDPREMQSRIGTYVIIKSIITAVPEEDNKQNNSKLVQFKAWGLPSFDNYSCTDSISKVFGFEYVWVAGCVVNSADVRKWERHNKTSDAKMVARHGKNWREQYNTAIKGCEINSLEENK